MERYPQIIFLLAILKRFGGFARNVAMNGRQVLTIASKVWGVRIAVVGYLNVV